MAIVSVSLPDELLTELDSSVKNRGFATRSEVIRNALRAFMAEHRSLKEVEGEVVITITIIFEKGAKNDPTFNIQHEYRNLISTFLHSHVDENNCLEVMIVRGDVDMIKKLVDAIKANDQIAQVNIAVLKAK